MLSINKIICGDCLEVLTEFPNDCVDLVFCSPPYEDARLLNINFNLKGQAWVDWAIPRFIECIRVCKGLVAWVVEGRTKKYRWSATPALLMADLHQKGVNLRKPPVFYRFGIPGSGGSDWLRNDYEFIICATKGGRLPWSDVTVMGKPCKFPVGGEMSYRNKYGQRKNQRHRKNASESQRQKGIKGHTVAYNPPDKANPGNVIKCNVGGGIMGSKIANENEAPFPEKLAEFFIRSFCPSEGIVLDPFIGSGTTAAVAERFGRKWIGIDFRQSEVERSQRRIEEVKAQMALFQKGEL